MELYCLFEREDKKENRAFLERVLLDAIACTDREQKRPAAGATSPLYSASAELRDGLFYGKTPYPPFILHLLLTRKAEGLSIGLLNFYLDLVKRFRSDLQKVIGNFIIISDIPDLSP